jgi:prepilin-type N-terminal cleavage/methylation domain-containing protein
MRRGFTLIELLLVLAIIGIAVAVTMPSMIRSMRGNQLRSAARTVVSAGRYARSMAVVSQKDLCLHISLDDGEISVQALNPPRRPGLGDAGADPPPASAAGQKMPAGGAVQGGTNAAAAGGTVAPEVPALKRTLDGVTIVSVEVEDMPQLRKGACDVIYRSNGRCRPYIVRIADSEKDEVRITVDALASAEIE